MGKFKIPFVAYINSKTFRGSFYDGAEAFLIEKTKSGDTIWYKDEYTQLWFKESELQEEELI